MGDQARADRSSGGQRTLGTAIVVVLLRPPGEVVRGVLDEVVVEGDWVLGGPG